MRTRLRNRYLRADCAAALLVVLQMGLQTAHGDDLPAKELAIGPFRGSDQFLVVESYEGEILGGDLRAKPAFRAAARIQTSVTVIPDDAFGSPPVGWRPTDDTAPKPLKNDASSSEGSSREVMTEVQQVTDLVPVQALELPELPTPFVDAVSAQLISPRVAQPAPAVMLAPPEPVAAHEEPAPAFAPKPLTPVAGETSPSASSEDLEGMLQGMAWVTGTLGLGAVLSLWMLRTWLTRGGRMISTSKSLKLIETLRVGPRCGLYLVQAESHRVLVGVEHGKSMCLMPLPPSFTESLDDATNDDQAAPPPAAGFERIADVFAALRKTDERAKGVTS